MLPGQTGIQIMKLSKKKINYIVIEDGEVVDQADFE